MRLVFHWMKVKASVMSEDDDADGGAVALLADLEAVAVGVGHEHRGGVARAAAGHDEDQVEHLERRDDVHDQQEERARPDERHGDASGTAATRFAPSILAASYSSGEMPCSPAR